MYEIGVWITGIIGVSVFTFFFIGQLVYMCWLFINDEETSEHKENWKGQNEWSSKSPPTLIAKMFPNFSYKHDLEDAGWFYMCLVFCAIVTVPAVAAWPLTLVVSIIIVFMFGLRGIIRLNKKLKAHVEDTKVHNNG